MSNKIKTSEEIIAEPRNDEFAVPPSYYLVPLKQMKIFNLTYFAKSDEGISGSSFENKDRNIKVNLNYLLSVSDLQKFELPFSGKLVGEYATVTMSNNDRYYIRKDMYKILSLKIK